MISPSPAPELFVLEIETPLPDSTRADSPGRDLVSSSQDRSPHCPPRKACKTSVATQCDPEEIIVLSDSD
ncbi:death domain-associated protein 6 [Grus japonensis]|uniref:Death domain-associated protein 6 n=1 Tax=Grus japonensis TaxID=30415 RepID=A0ABC9XXJ0_GRUJA